MNFLLDFDFNIEVLNKMDRYIFINFIYCFER